MKVTNTNIPDVKIFEPKVFGDDRGFFYESYNKQILAELGLHAEFVQDNHSKSTKGVLRGIHYQIQHPQGKLVRVTAGEVYDIAVDLRKSSPSFGQWIGVNLSANNKRMLWVPEGFGHAFLVLSETAEFLYKTTDYYYPAFDRCIIWNDPTLAIDWPIDNAPTLSAKDSQGKLFNEAEVYA